jgi:hypothetical protein
MEFWPFTKRTQARLPDEHLERIEQIPEEFESDGCSNSPDRWCGWDLRPYCLVHDWEHCSRCHKPEEMNHAHRVESNERLRRGLDNAIPWRWGFIKHIYYSMVNLFGGVRSWDSCGPTVGERCRHNMPMPMWMKESINGERAEDSA